MPTIDEEMNELERGPLAPPSLDEGYDTPTTDPREDRVGSTAADLARPGLRSARERVEQARTGTGSARMFPETDNRLRGAVHNTLGAILDVGLAGLDTAEAAAGAGIGLATELVPGQSDAEERQLGRDLMAMPEAFAASAPAAARDAPDRIEDAITGGKMAGEQYMDYAESLGDPSVTRLFLGPNTKGADTKAYDKAQKMQSQGKTREEIWEKTGWFQLNGEWLYEIPDVDTEIFLTAKAKGLDKGGTTTKTTPGRGLNLQERLRLQNEFKGIELAIRKKIDNGEITKEEGLENLREAQTALDSALGMKTEAQTVTTTTPSHPAGNLKIAGTLDEVLWHPELKKNIDLPTERAQAGKHYDEPGSYGVYYPRVYDQARLDQDKVARGYRINAFTEAKKSRMAGSPEENIKSTLLHEVQHFIDDVSNSKHAGYSPESAGYLKNTLSNEYKNRLTAIRHTDDFKSARSILNRSIPEKDYKFTLTDADNVLQLIAKGLDGNAEMKIASRMVGDKNTTAASALNEAKEVVAALRKNKNAASALGKYSDVFGSKGYRLSEMDRGRIYQMEGGEVKARLAQHRMKMTPEQRKKEAPWKTLSKIGPEDLVFSPQEFSNPGIYDVIRDETDDLEQAQ